MSILRVVLAAAPAATSEAAWALFDAQGRVLQRGCGAPATWPQAARREAVCAAATVRMVSLALPPMPADRLPAAAAYALEDQLAGPAHEQQLTISRRDEKSRVLVIVAARALIASLHTGFARIVAEPALATPPPAGRWRWLASGGGGSFVRRPDGSAFAAGPPDAGGPAPAELELALAQARRSNQAPAAVDAAFAVDDARLAAWAAQCGVAFVRSSPWRWDEDATAFAAAPDLTPAESKAATKGTPAPRPSRAWRLALFLACAALVLHIGATVGQWALLRVDLWRASRAIVDVAAQTGVQAADADAAADGLARRYADARHRAGLAAPGDALPLLALAAPALGALPTGMLRSAVYVPEHWTFDMAKATPEARAALDRALTGAGLAVVLADTPGGLRARIVPARGAGLPK